MQRTEVSYSRRVQASSCIGQASLSLEELSLGSDIQTVMLSETQIAKEVTRRAPRKPEVLFVCLSDISNRTMGSKWTVSAHNELSPVRSIELDPLLALKHGTDQAPSLTAILHSTAASFVGGRLAPRAR